MPDANLQHRRQQRRRRARERNAELLRQRDDSDSILQRNLHVDKENNRLNVDGALTMCELAALLPFGSTMDDMSYEIALAIELAIRHLNRGDGSIVSELPSLRETCPIFFDAIFADTQRNPKKAFAVIDELTRPQEPLSKTTPLNSTITAAQPRQLPKRPPCAVVGAIDSRISKTTGLVTGLRDIPQISMASTSSDLSNPVDFPLFGRTTPDDAFGTEIFIRFLHDTMEIRNVFVIFESHPFTQSMAKRLREAIRNLGWAPGQQRNDTNNDSTIYMSTHMIESKGFLAEGESVGMLEDAVRALKRSQYRFVILLTSEPSIRDRVLETAYREGLAGNGDYHWWMTDPKYQEFPKDSILAKVYDGTGTIHTVMDRRAAKYAEFERQSEELKRELYQGFGGDHTEPMDSNPRSASGRWHEWLERDESEWLVDGSYRSEFPGFAYDATVLLGISACRELAESPGNNLYLSGADLFRRVKQTTFNGITGDIVLDPDSGSRDGHSVQYAIKNWRAVPKANASDMMVFEPTITHLYLPGGSDDWDTLAPYYFNGGETELRANPDLPPLKIEPLQPGQWVLGLAIGLGILLLMGALGFSIWTCLHSESRVVRASQPFFLQLLCFGIAVMALAIFPISLEHFATGEWNSLCNSFIWLFSMGSGIIFSTLFAKTYRINKIISSSMSCRRITLTIRQTLSPVFIMLAYNIILLSVMMKYGRVRHEAIYLNEDIFGRPTEVYHTCSYREAMPFLIPLVLGNFGMVFLASFQAWHARHLSTEFAESYYIAMALLVSFVALILAIPVLFLTKDNQTIDTFITTLFVFLVASNVLLFIFIPKVRRYTDSQLPVRDTKNCSAIKATMPSSLTHSSVQRITEMLGDRILTTKSARQLATENKSLEHEVQMLKKKERTLQLKNNSLQERLRAFIGETDTERDPLVNVTKSNATVSWDDDYRNVNTSTDNDDCECEHNSATNSSQHLMQLDKDYQNGNTFIDDGDGESEQIATDIPPEELIESDNTYYFDSKESTEKETKCENDDAGHIDDSADPDPTAVIETVDKGDDTDDKNKSDYDRIDDPLPLSSTNTTVRDDGDNTDESQ